MRDLTRDEMDTIIGMTVSYSGDCFIDLPEEIYDFYEELDDKTDAEMAEFCQEFEEELLSLEEAEEWGGSKEW